MILCTRLVSGMTFIRYAHNIKILKTQIFIKSVGAGKVKGLKQDGQTHCLREIDRVERHVYPQTVVSVS
jgi:hypothetical protein